MAKSFEAQFEDFVLAVALCDAASTKNILQSEWYEMNAEKIRNHGLDVGFIEVPLTIHNIAQCWEIILSLDNVRKEFLARYDGNVERLHQNNKEIIEILKQKFSNSEDYITFKKYACCIPYGLMEVEDYCCDRSNPDANIDIELLLALDAYDLERFEELIQQGANPWNDLSDSSWDAYCVWERIVARSTCDMNELLHDVLERKEYVDLEDLLTSIISVAGYACFDRLLQRYIPFEDGPIRTKG